jgi:hypothetical protein
MAPARQEGETSLFIQWKGTDACADFACRCGVFCHFDRDFLYNIKCHACGTIYRVPDTFILEEVPETEARMVQETWDEGY